MGACSCGGEGVGLIPKGKKGIELTTSIVPSLENIRVVLKGLPESCFLPVQNYSRKIETLDGLNVFQFDWMQQRETNHRADLLKSGSTGRLVCQFFPGYPRTKRKELVVLCQRV